MQFSTRAACVPLSARAVFACTAFRMILLVEEFADLCSVKARISKSACGAKQCMESEQGSQMWATLA